MTYIYQFNDDFKRKLGKNKEGLKANRNFPRETER